MTDTQVKYWDYREGARHNKVMEGETRRHNVVMEGETNRHNKVTEYVDKGDLKERIRHNKKTEGVEKAKVKEMKRSNLRQESLKAQDLAIKANAQSLINALNAKKLSRYDDEILTKAGVYGQNFVAGKLSGEQMSKTVQKVMKDPKVSSTLKDYLKPFTDAKRWVSSKVSEFKKDWKTGEDLARANHAARSRSKRDKKDQKSKSKRKK